MPDYTRQSSINVFFEGGTGQTLLKAVQEAMLTEVNAGLIAVEPNWSQFEIDFLPEAVPDFLTRSPRDEDGCRMSFDFMPRIARLKGPEHGITDVTEAASLLLSEPLLAWLRMLCEFRDEYEFVLYNPAHQIAFIEGRTIIAFSDGSRGVVQNVREGGGAFEVCRDADDVLDYNLSALYAEMHGQPNLGRHGPRAIGILYADAPMS